MSILHPGNYHLLLGGTTSLLLEYLSPHYRVSITHPSTVLCVRSLNVKCKKLMTYEVTVTKFILNKLAKMSNFDDITHVRRITKVDTVFEKKYIKQNAP